MIDCSFFYNLLLKNGVSFFAGVPDSLLKEFLNCVYEKTTEENNVITANEGNAIGLATGYNLATGKIPMVYMQNSGEGNIINPLVSLVDKNVYGIPMLLMVGWRGEPGVKDEPQHFKQGQITTEILKVLDIPFSVLPEEEKEVENVLSKAVAFIKDNNSPYALVVRKGTFDTFTKLPKVKNSVVENNLSREDAMKVVLSNISSSDVVISTTGKLSREIDEYKKASNQSIENCFFNVGAMGHVSSIALGVAKSLKDKRVFCLDGDGSFIMHMGAVAIIGASGVTNFKHIVFNNGAHDSVGGQKTVGDKVDISSVAKACKYATVKAATESEIAEGVHFLLEYNQGPCLLEIKIKKGARKDLGRPSISPQDRKEMFTKFLSGKK